MKAQVYIVALLSVVAIAVNAQTTTSSNLEYNPIQSQQIIKAGAHTGTVYEPFSTTTPSEQTTVGTYSPNSPSGPRRVIGTNPDGGEGSNDSPIGDAVWPLMLMAMVFCGVIALRRKQKAKQYD